MPPVFENSHKIKVILLTSKYESDFKFVLMFEHLYLFVCVHIKAISSYWSSLHSNLVAVMCVTDVAIY
jgi:hypothetical protein